MGLIEYYLIFAITTSIFSLIDIFIPLIKAAEAKNINNAFTENPLLSYTIYFFITIIIAPLVILPMLVPSMNERFRSTMSRIVEEEE